MNPSSFEDAQHLFSYIEEVLKGGKKPSVHCFILIVDPESTLQQAVDRAVAQGSVATLLTDANALPRLRLQSSRKNDIEHLFEVDGAWLYFVEGESGPLKSKMSTLASRAYPLMKLGFLPSGRMLRLLNELKRDYDELLVTEGTLCTEGQTFRNWKKAPVKYSASQMERLANRDGGKWTSISFRAIAGEAEVFHCRVYERGHVTLYGGNFADFYSDVLIPYVARTLEHQKSLSGKQRQDLRSGPNLHPISFDLPRPLELADMGYLQKATISNYSAAVMHDGNPMLMIQLCDRDDGSFYDLYAYDRKIQIVPHQRATSGSLSELVALVTEVLPKATPSLTQVAQATE